jgi:hypothetical protein
VVFPPVIFAIKLTDPKKRIKFFYSVDNMSFYKKIKKNEYVELLHERELYKGNCKKKELKKKCRAGVKLSISKTKGVEKKWPGRQRPSPNKTKGIRKGQAGQMRSR